MRIIASYVLFSDGISINQYDNYGNDEFPHFVRMITPLFEETTVNIRDGLLPTYEQLFR